MSETDDSTQETVDGVATADTVLDGVVPDGPTDPVSGDSSDADGGQDSVQYEAVYDEIRLVKTFDTLESRWQDEKAHEDFEAYRKAMQIACDAAGVSFVRLEAEPFTFEYKHMDTEMKMTIKDGQIHVERRTKE